MDQAARTPSPGPGRRDLSHRDCSRILARRRGRRSRHSDSDLNPGLPGREHAGIGPGPGQNRRRRPQSESESESESGARGCTSAQPGWPARPLAPCPPGPVARAAFRLAALAGRVSDSDGGSAGPGRGRDGSDIEGPSVETSEPESQ